MAGSVYGSISGPCVRVVRCDGDTAWLDLAMMYGGCYQ